MKESITLCLRNGEVESKEGTENGLINADLLAEGKLDVRVPLGFTGIITIHFDGSCRHERGGEVCCRRITLRDERREDDD